MTKSFLLYIMFYLCNPTFLNEKSSCDYFSLHSCYSAFKCTRTLERLFEQKFCFEARGFNYTEAHTLQISYVMILLFQTLSLWTLVSFTQFQIGFHRALRIMQQLFHSLWIIRKIFQLKFKTLSGWLDK